MFGEQYPDPVRVVSIGKPIEELLANPEEPSNRQYSIEFCGGTHLEHTGQARAFALLSEEGIAKVTDHAHAHRSRASKLDSWQRLCHYRADHIPFEICNLVRSCSHLLANAGP